MLIIESEINEMRKLKEEIVWVGRGNLSINKQTTVQFGLMNLLQPSDVRDFSKQEHCTLRLLQKLLQDTDYVLNIVYKPASLILE